MSRTDNPWEVPVCQAEHPDFGQCFLEPSVEEHQYGHESETGHWPVEAMSLTETERINRTEDILLVSAPDVEAAYKNIKNWASYLHLDNVLVIPVDTFFRNRKFFEGIRVSNIYATQEAKLHPDYPEIKEILGRSKAFSEPREPRIQLVN